VRERDGGYALLWSLALAGALLIVGGCGLSLGALALAHARAQNAADLAAIAGAQNPLDPCGSARRIAGENSAELLDCTVADGDVIVRAGVHAPAVARWWGGDVLEVTARAGPSAS